MCSSSIPPRGTGIQSNQLLDPLVELCDLMPTLREFAGLPISKGVEDRSFLPILLEAQ